MLVTHWVHQEVLAYLETTCDVIANESRVSWPRETVRDLAADCDAVMAFPPDRIDAAFLRACPRLKIVAAALSGPDHFDPEAFTRRGIWLSASRDLLAVPTAELAIGLMIALGRNFNAGDSHVRSGRFEGWRPRHFGTGMSGSTLGVIGLGAVGRALADRALGLNMRVVYADPRETSTEFAHVGLEQLLAISDYVVPLSQSSHHMIDAATLGRMKHGARLINVGRGGLVDEAAVAASLAAGRLAGYAADVFEMEDWAVQSRPRALNRDLLQDRARTFFTPHFGAAVEEAGLAMATAAADNILDALCGRRPRDAVNRIGEEIAA